MVIKQLVLSPLPYPSLPSTTTSLITSCLSDVTYSTRAYLVPTQARLFQVEQKEMGCRVTWSWVQILLHVFIADLG